MNTVTWLLTVIILFFSVFSEVLTAKIILTESAAQVSPKNPFRSLMPLNKASSSLPQLPTKTDLPTKLQSYVDKNKTLDQTVFSKVPEVQSSQRLDISSRVKQLTQILKQKDTFETLEGRYAIIDENNVTYFVKKGGRLDEVYVVEQSDKNQLELKGIDGETTIILELHP